jgi:hypothetical protein
MWSFIYYWHIARANDPREARGGSTAVTVRVREGEGAAGSWERGRQGALGSWVDRERERGIQDDLGNIVH